MSCSLGESPRPFTGCPFSSSAESLLMLLRSRWTSPCRSATVHAISMPRALYHGPSPIRSRALPGGRLRPAREHLPQLVAMVRLVGDEGVELRGQAVLARGLGLLAPLHVARD